MGAALALTFGALTLAGPAAAATPNTVIATLSTAPNPELTAVDPVRHIAWVLGEQSVLNEIDESTNTIVGTFPLGGNSSPSQLTVDPRTGNLVISLLDGAVDVVSEAHPGTVARVISGIPNSQPNPTELAVNPQTGMVYLPYINDSYNYFSGNTEGGVAVFNEQTGTVVANIKDDSFPDGVAVDERNDTVYISNILSPLGKLSGEASVWVLNGQTNKVTSSITNLPEPGVLSFDPTTNRLFAADPYASAVSVINTSNNTVIGNVSLGTEGPTAVAVDYANGMVYAEDEVGDNSVSVISEKTDTVVATIPLNGEPSDLGVDPSTGLVYVNTFNGYESVIQAAP